MNPSATYPNTRRLNRLYRLSLTLLALALGMLSTQTLAAQKNEPSAEDSIKAAMLYRFLFFVKKNTPDNNIYRIGISQDEKLYEAFKTIHHVSPDKIQLEIITLHPDTPLQKLETLDLLYSSCDFFSAQGYDTKLAGLPILTVTSSDTCFQSYGIIYLKKTKDRYRFEIHEARAKARKLKLDAKLLRLATEVHR